MQGHFASQYRNKVRDDRIKGQKEEQIRKLKNQNLDKVNEDDFQTVSKRKAQKIKYSQNNQQQIGKYTNKIENNQE